ncbi:PulJ/GspJ family protein [Lignipirellula cremea]|uniref:Prepilin-type N-terminal cleavage/methylation domain-containing protein n=1 Tax=Lignipirellula cremea TaxID=2528010 RepID=A0A518DS87_9BACT|nr:hypothetical protein [Lignipirellula cremea]QDU94707.1 hypothetical protein Pla8534_25130 [Lignipirellula cremea]
MNRRTGSSLIEVLTAVALTTVLAGLSTAAIHTIYRANQTIVAGSEQRQQISRLARHLRRDAQLAVDCQAAADQQSLTFTLPDGRNIQYEHTSRGVRRFVRLREKTIHRDAFVLPGSETQFALVTLAEQPASDSKSRMIAQVILQFAGDEKNPRRQRRIEAAVSARRPE